MDLKESIAALEEFLSCLKAREVPRMFSEEAERVAKCTEGYRYFTKKYGMEPRSFAHEQMMWTIVDLAWTQQLARTFGGLRVLEVMSGVGWLAKALRTHGVDVTATDRMDWRKDWAPNFGETVTEVEELSAPDAVAKYGATSDVLILAWPSSSDDANAAELWGSEKPIYYIGERPGGCTGSDRFFAGFVPETRFEVPRFSGNWDRLFIGRFDQVKAATPLECDDMGYPRYDWPAEIPLLTCDLQDA